MRQARQIRHLPPLTRFTYLRRPAALKIVASETSCSLILEPIANARHNFAFDRVPDQEHRLDKVLEWHETLVHASACVHAQLVWLFRRLLWLLIRMAALNFLVPIRGI